MLEHPVRCVATSDEMPPRRNGTYVSLKSRPLGIVKPIDHLDIRRSWRACQNRRQIQIQRGKGYTILGRSNELQKTLLRRVGKAVHEYDMIREGDRIAVGVSGGKDSLTLLDALLLLEKRSPVKFSVQAFTVEQGKFVRPIEPVGEYLKGRGIPWTYYRDDPSFQLLEEQPDHGCDLCSRYRRRAVYDIASTLGANVVALGHTADDFCESLLRNTLYTGRLSSLPPVTWSRSKDFRLIRPLVFVSEEVTTAYAEKEEMPVTPCVCSHRSGTVRRSLREFLDETKKDHPFVLENILSAMSRIDTPRLLDRRFLDSEEAESPAPADALPVLQDTL